ncbi:MAG: DUF721 domain-containing protein [Lentisphaeria bacterium]|nr:DUF721 domain-containing protein [Lentisphaeria bacterium]
MQYTWEDNLDGFERRKRNKKERERETVNFLRSNWYGRESGRLETASHDEIRLFSDIADDFLSKNLKKSDKNRVNLAVEWEKIVGREIAMILGFAELKDGVLYLEIKHPAYLQEELAETTDLIIDQVNEVMKEKICSEIKFVPKGRRR